MIEAWKSQLRKGAAELAVLAVLAIVALVAFVDAILAQKLGESIKPADCGKIERAMELLSPLPPENLGGLLTFVMDVTGNRQPAVCDVDG